MLSAPLSESLPVVQIERLVSQLDASLPKADIESPAEVALTPEQFDSLLASW
jgi:hypothetical protein